MVFCLLCIHNWIGYNWVGNPTSQLIVGKMSGETTTSEVFSASGNWKPLKDAKKGTPESRFPIGVGRLLLRGELFNFRGVGFFLVASSTPEMGRYS